MKLSAQIDTDINVSSITPSSCSLGINATCTFNVTFDSSKNAAMGNHTGTFKAYKSDDESISDSKTFVVRVAQTQERIEFVKQLYQKVSDNFTKYVQQFNQFNSTGLNLSSANLSAVSVLLKEINTTLITIGAYMSNTTYELADPLLKGLQSTMNTLEEKMQVLKNEYDIKFGLSGGTMIFWAIVIIIIAGVVGFLIYLFLPPAGYSPRRGYAPKKDMLKKMEKVFSQAKEKSKKIKIKRK